MATPNPPTTTLHEHHQDTKDHQISHLEHGHASDDEKKSLEDDPLTYFTPEEQKKIIHRLDRRLVVVVGVMYCVSLMDRTNLSNAAIAGMSVELKLGIEMRYSIVTLVFFITYIIFQPPATVLTRKIGPRIFLAGLCIAWGAVMIGMGFTHNWAALAACRVILGLLEAGFFPVSERW
jgi:sugar phosphate permease